MMPHSQSMPTSGEENAWHAAFLGQATQMLNTDLPNYAILEPLTRCFARHSITQGNEAPYCGITTKTVAPGLTVYNHIRLNPQTGQYEPIANPSYALSIFHSLHRGALAYLAAGKQIPPEFLHNVANLYDQYLMSVTDRHSLHFHGGNILDWSGATNTFYYAGISAMLLRQRTGIS